MKATKIKMKPGCSNSTKTTEIDQIYMKDVPIQDISKKLHYMIILNPILIAYM